VAGPTAQPAPAARSVAAGLRPFALSRFARASPTVGNARMTRSLSSDVPRGSRSESRQRQIVVRMRVDSQEYAAILASARSLNLSLSAYVRDAALRQSEKRQVTELETIIVAEIASIVSRVEKAAQAEESHVQQGALAAALADLRALSDHIVRRML
jgi:hypothetical protein